MNTRRALFRLLKPVNRGQEGKNQEYQQNAAHDADTKSKVWKASVPPPKTSAPRMPSDFPYAYRQ